MYPKLQGHDLKQLKELIERNGWKNVQLSLDDIRSASDKAAQQQNAADGAYCACQEETPKGGYFCIACNRPSPPRR